MPVYQIAYPYNYAMKSSVLFHVAGGYSISRGDIQASRKVPRHSDGVFKEGFGSLISIVIRYCIAKQHREYGLLSIIEA